MLLQVQGAAGSPNLEPLLNQRETHIVLVAKQNRVVFFLSQITE
jgi:hypothetical protein